MTKVMRKLWNQFKRFEPLKDFLKFSTPEMKYRISKKYVSNFLINTIRLKGCVIFCLTILMYRFRDFKRLKLY